MKSMYLLYDEYGDSTNTIIIAANKKEAKKKFNSTYNGYLKFDNDMALEKCVVIR